jgi:hypothetical protein
MLHLKEMPFIGRYCSFSFIELYCCGFDRRQLGDCFSFLSFTGRTTALLRSRGVGCGRFGGFSR